MMPSNIITSKENGFVKKVVKLANNRNYRYQELLSVVYGEHLILEAINARILKHLIIASHAIHKYSDIVAKIDNSIVEVIDEKILTKINILDSKVDIIGLITINELAFDPTLYTLDCVLLDSIQDPGNLGTILRSVAACGIKNVFLSANSVDAYNPKVLRASQGVQFRLNIYQNIDLNKFINSYKGIVVATVPSANKDLYALDLKDNISWVFGNEGAGLNNEMLALIKTQVKIPMSGNVESLNIATAASVCLFEMVRQRLAA